MSKCICKDCPSRATHKLWKVDSKKRGKVDVDDLVLPFCIAIFCTHHKDGYLSVDKNVKIERIPSRRF